MEFLREQQTNLERLERTLTPDEKVKYNARLKKLQTTLNLKIRKLSRASLENQARLEIMNESRSKPRSKPIKEQKPKEQKPEKPAGVFDTIKKINDLNKNLKDKKGDLSDVFKNNIPVSLAIGNSVRANITTIPTEAREAAILSRASTVFKRFGLEQAKNYLAAHEVGYEILPESTGEGLVVRNIKTGKIKVAFRGTMIPKDLAEVKTSVGDIGTDLAVVTGYEGETEQFKSADELVGSIKTKYGNNLDEILGYSLGGAKAIRLGDKYGIDTKTFNPLIGKNHIQASETASEHQIYRTTEDIPSLGAGLIDRPNVVVKAILPIKRSIFNVKSHHDIENFIEGKRPRATESQKKQVGEDLLRSGAKVAEYHTIDGIVDYIDEAENQRPALPKFGQQMSESEAEAMRNRFKLFEEPNFTKFIHTVHNKNMYGVETNADGELLPTTRMNDKSPIGQFWKKAGGEFTEEEQALFDNQRESGNSVNNTDSVLTDEEIDRFVNSSKDVRKQIFEDHNEKTSNLIDRYNEVNDITTVFPMNGSDEIQAPRPGNVGFGASTGINLLGGVAASQAVKGTEYITGLHLSRGQETGAVGGLGGLFGAAGVARLGGSALSNPELGAAAAVGTASALVGMEAGDLTKKAGGGRFAQTEASGTSGGATAGFLGTVAAGALTGGIDAVPLDFETLGLASVIGAGIGGTIAGIGYGMDKAGIHIPLPF